MGADRRPPRDRRIRIYHSIAGPGHAWGAQRAAAGGGGGAVGGLERVCALHVWFVCPSRYTSVRRGSLRVSARRNMPRGAGGRLSAGCVCLRPSSSTVPGEREEPGGGERERGVKNRLRFSREGPRSHSWHISSSSCHAACKTIPREEGAGSWPPGQAARRSCRKAAGADGQHGQGPPGITPTPTRTPLVHTSKHRLRAGEAPAQTLGQGLFTGESGSHCFRLQAPK